MFARHVIHRLVAAATVLVSVVSADAGPLERFDPSELVKDPKPRFERTPERNPGGAGVPDKAPRNDYTGARSMLVELDAAKVRKRADWLRSRKKLEQDDRAIRRYKSNAYARLQMTFAASAVKLGVKVEQTFKNVPVVAVHIERDQQIDRLEGIEGVVAVHENLEFVPFLNESLPQVGQPAAAVMGARGRGTSVAVLDTGVDFTDPAFGGCTSPGQPAGCRVGFAAEFALPDGAMDDDGHGTNVAGIVLGMAPATNILSLDVFERVAGDAITNVIGIVAAIDFLIDTKFLFNTVAMNLSLGTDGLGSRGRCLSPVDSPFAEAQAVGIMPIVATGNDSQANRVSVPACSPWAVAVGAVDEADAVAGFSNGGSSIDLLAPGTDITAAGFTKSGTSMATPHVAGAFAVMAGARRDLSQYQLLQALKDTGVPITDPRQGRVTPRIQLNAALSWSPVLVLPAPLENYLDISPIEWAWAECQMEEIADGFECGWNTVVEPVTSEALCGLTDITSEVLCGTIEVTSEALCGLETITNAAICGVEEILMRPWDVLSGMSCSCTNFWCTCSVASSCPAPARCDQPATCQGPATCPFERTCEPALEICDPMSCEVEVCAF